MALRVYSDNKAGEAYVLSHNIHMSPVSQELQSISKTYLGCFVENIEHHNCDKCVLLNKRNQNV